MPKLTELKRVTSRDTLQHAAGRVFLVVARFVRLERVSPLFSYTRIRARLSARLLNSRRLATGMVLVLGLVAVGFGLAHPEATDAATNNTINFQARLETAAGAIAPDGNYNVEFKLYDASTSGTLLWTEDWLNSATNGIHTTNGYLTANLGSITAFPTTINWDQQLYITMNIGNTSSCTITTNFTSDCSGDGEMTPRLRLTGVPYAFRAGQLAQYNNTTGYTSTLSLVQPTGGNQLFQIPDQGAAGTYNLLTTAAASTGYIQNQNSGQQATANFWISGTGRADTMLQAPAFDTATSGSLSIGTTNATSITLGKSGVNTTVAGNLNVGTATSYGAITIANGAWITGVDSTGSSAVNILQVNANNQIQLGAALQVDGGITFPTNAGQVTLSDLPIDSSASAGTPESYSLRVGTSNVLTVYGEADGSGNLQNGRVAIGSSISPQFTLDAGGDINTSGVYRVNGTAGLTATTCSAGYALTASTVTGGIVTAGTCTNVAPATGSGNYIQNVKPSAGTPQSGNFYLQSADTTTNPSVAIKAIAGQSADLLQAQNSSGTAIAGINPNGIYTNGQLGVGGGLPSGYQLLVVDNNTLRVGLAVRAIASQTADLLELQDSSSNVVTNFDASGALHVQQSTSTNVLIAVKVTGDTNDRLDILANGTLAFGSGSGATDVNITRSGSGTLEVTGNLEVGTATAIAKLGVALGGNAVGELIQASGSQTSDLFQLAPSGSTTPFASFGATGQLTLGRITTSLTPYAGTLSFSDGTTDGYKTTITATTLTANQTLSLPNESGTICLQNSTNCGFATSSGSGNYIQAQGSTPGTGQNTNFNLGTGVGIAATFNATTGINTGSGSGTQRIDASGNLSNIGTYSGSGNITTTGGILTVQGTGTSYFSGNINVTNNQNGTASYYILNNNAGSSANALLQASNGTGNGFFGITSSAYSIAILQNRASLYADSSTAGIAIVNAGAQPILFGVSNAEVARFDTSGNLTFNSARTVSTSSGNLTIQGGSGTVSLGSSTTLTASGALSVTSAGSNTNLTLTAVGTGTASLDTGGAGTVNVGATTATTVNVGNGGSATAIKSGSSLLLGNNAVNKTISIGVTGSTANTTAVNIATSTGAAQTIAIGGTGASSGSNSASTINIQGGATNIKVANAGATLQTFTNSVTAFQIQNAASEPVFVVDTTTNNLISNPGFEVNTTGWGGSGTGVAVAQNLTLTKVYAGISSLKITTATSGTTTATVTGFTSTLSAGTYNFSFYMMGDNTATLGSTVTFTGGGGTCTLGSTSVVTTGFNRYSCSVTTTGTTTGISFTTATNNAVLYLDAVQLTSGSTNLVPYRIGGIQLRGVLTSPVAIQTTSNSTAAFQIQDNTGTANLFVADTLNGRIGIGTAAPGFSLDVQGGDINTSANLRTGGTTRLDNSGNLSNIGTYNGSGNITTTGGVLTVQGTGTNTFSGGASFGSTIFIYSNANASTGIYISNTNGGTGAASMLQATNGTGNAFSGIGGTAYGYAILQNRAVVASDSGTAGIGISTLSAQPIAFGINTTEVARFTTSGSLQLGVPSAFTGTLVVANTSNSNTVTLTSGVTSASYSLTLPTAAPSGSGQCLSTSSSTQLTFTTCGGGGGVSTIGTLDGGTANSNGAYISSTTLYMQSASATNPGLVNNTTQAFSGDKTFQSTSSTAFTVQDTTGASALTVNNLDDLITIGSAGPSTYSEGFEGGSLSGWTVTGGATVNTTHAHNGTHAANVVASSSAVGATKTITTISSGTVSVSAYVYTGTATTSGGPDLFGLSSSTSGGTYHVSRNNSTLALVNNYDGLYRDSGVPIPTNQWVKLEIIFTMNNSGGSTATLYMNGTAIATANGESTPTSINQVFIGDAGGATTQSIWIDDMAVSNSSNGNLTNLQVNGNLQASAATFTGTTYITADSTSAFVIQDTAAEPLFSADTLNGIITIGDAVNNLSISYANGFQPILSGTARHTKTITLNAEYAGAILDATNDATCSSVTAGTMTAGNDLTNRMNYYNWTATSTTAQCFDVVVQIPIPSDWSAWSSTTPFSLQTYSSSTANTGINLEVRDSSGSVETNDNFASVNPGSASTWTSTTGGGAIGGSYTAGGYMTMRIRMSAKNTANVRIGNITLTYLSQY